MSIYTVSIGETKFFYALLRQGYEVLRRAMAVRDQALAFWFPNVAEEWGAVKRILSLGIASPIAWTGMSMTKSDTVPDDTRVPPAVEINGGTVRAMYALASAEGVTLAGDQEFYDEANMFAEAFVSWSSACRALMKIEDLLREATLYAMAAAQVEGAEGTLERSPAQIVMFDAAEVPLGDGGRWSEQWSVAGIEAGFGSFYQDFLLQPTEETFIGGLPDLSVERQEVVVAGIDDPDNPGVKTVYEFFAQNGFALAGMIMAKGGDSYYRTPEYLTASSGVVRVNLPVAEAPAELTVLMLGVKTV